MGGRWRALQLRRWRKQNWYMRMLRGESTIDSGHWIEICSISSSADLIFDTFFVARAFRAADLNSICTAHSPAVSACTSHRACALAAAVTLGPP